jgi:alpha-tubulin suppressor-like RCC1 family protein
MNRLTPTLVTGGISDWVAVSAGDLHTCAVRKNGQVYCWGYNAYGQLGDGTTSNRAIPTLVSGGFTDWIEVSSGGFHTCARRINGQLYCWGYNNYGQLGNGTLTNQTVPALVAGGFTDWVTVTTGLYHACAVRSSGALYCWGYNFFGQLGIGSTTNQNTPSLVSGGSWRMVSGGEGHTCGLSSSLYCWGNNSFGQIGDGTTQNRTTPTLVSGTFFSISSGGSHSCGTQSRGVLYCWGYNGYGQLGDGTTTNRLVPVMVSY